MRWWGGRLGFEILSVVDWGRGPALPLREAAWALLFGVPGPREDCRREDEVGGMERWVFRRRRFVSVDGERAVEREAELGWRLEAAVMGAVVVRGEGWRVGWTRRVMGLLAMVVEGPAALPERGCRGVDAPVVEVERGGRRVVRLAVLLFRREGSWGSMAIAPSFWRSRILRSSRLI